LTLEEGDISVDSNDMYCMQIAVEEARKSRQEDERVHPFVAAVLARDGRIPPRSST
jgi:hypothetical protein